MQIYFTEEHTAWRDTVRDFCEREIRPSLQKLDLSSPPSPEQIRALDDAWSGKGVYGEFPRNEDGKLDHIAFAILIEELSRIHHLPGFMAMQRISMPTLVANMLDDAQKEQFADLLPPTRATIGGAFSEPAAGSDSGAVRTTAKRNADGTWSISGHKIWISGASHVDALIAWTRVDKEIDPSGYGAFVVRRDTGYQVTPIKMMGLQGHEMCEVVFDNVVVPDIARIKGNAQAAVLGTIGLARPMTAVMATGYAQAALEMAIAYAKGREQFGKSIASFQLVQKLLADMATGVMSCRLMQYQAINTLMREGEKAARVESSMAKAYCTETAWQVCSMGMEVYGAMGLTAEAEIERLFRDARMLTVPDGTRQIHELVIGRSLTGMNAFA